MEEWMSILQSGTPNYLKTINKRKVLQEIIEGDNLIPEQVWQKG